MQVEQPTVIARLASLLEYRYGAPGLVARKTARELIKNCHDYGMDIVMSTWVNDPTVVQRGDPVDPFSKMTDILQTMEESGRTPWYPDGM